MAKLRSQTFSGKVISRRVSRSSKSERVAILLETDEGDFILRRKGGNPFRDDVVETLLGRHIEAKGQVAGTTLIMDTWEEIEGP
jgi:hypothetical protein